MRFVCIAAILLCFASPQNPTPNPGKLSKQQQKPSNVQQPTSTNQRGTEQMPFFVKTIPPPKTEGEVAEEAQGRKDKAANDRNLVVATYILAAIAALQLIVFGYQAVQLKQTVQAAGEQGEDLKRAIAQSSRSATAMEKVAQHLEVSIIASTKQSQSMELSVLETARFASAMEKAAEHIAASSRAAVDSVAALRERTAQQMRAYLTVIVGTAIYQEKLKNLKFEARPTLMNTGHTPAHKVGYIAKAAILPVPLADEFTFPLSGETNGASVLGSQQQNQLFAVVDDFCDDTDIQKIKSGEGKALFVWGIVHYEDIFGEHHITKFCQLLTWLPNENVFGFFIPKHNEAT